MKISGLMASFLMRPTCSRLEEEEEEEEETLLQTAIVLIQSQSGDNDTDINSRQSIPR